jgi:hypothetical protein
MSLRCAHLLVQAWSARLRPAQIEQVGQGEIPKRTRTRRAAVRGYRVPVQCLLGQANAVAVG